MNMDMMPAHKTRDTRPDEGEKERKRPPLVIGMLALLVVILVGGALFSRLSQTPQNTGFSDGPAVDWAPTTPPPLLPGETLWRGVPSMLWGTNDTQNWDQDNNLMTMPTIQKAAKDVHLALIRTWLFQYDLITNQPVNDDYQRRKVQAAQNTGARLLCELPTRNSAEYNERMVRLFAGKCSFYEFMNEPDNEQIPIETYAARWASEIPRLRQIDPHALFGGPAATTPQYSQCTYAADTTVCYMQKVLQRMALSKVLPDFVTFHWYPCWQEDADSCLKKAESYGAQVTLVRGWLTQYFGAAGARIPIGVTEWNADPSAPMPDYTQDACWIQQYSVTALKSMARAGASFANQFDLANTGGYGTDDMVDVSKNGAAKPQFVALTRLMETVSPYGRLPLPPLAYTPPASCPGVP